MADWVTISSLATAEDPSAVPDPDDFTRQQLDIYIPAGDSGYWQGALRDASAPGYQEVRAGMKNGDPVPDTKRATLLRYFSVDGPAPR